MNFSSCLLKLISWCAFKDAHVQRPLLLYEKSAELFQCLSRCSISKWCIILCCSAGQKKSLSFGFKSSCPVVLMCIKCIYSSNLYRHGSSDCCTFTACVLTVRWIYIFIWLWILVPYSNRLRPPRVSAFNSFSGERCISVLLRILMLSHRSVAAVLSHPGLSRLWCYLVLTGMRQGTESRMQELVPGSAGSTITKGLSSKVTTRRCCESSKGFRNDPYRDQGWWRRRRCPFSHQPTWRERNTQTQLLSVGCLDKCSGGSAPVSALPFHSLLQTICLWGCGTEWKDMRGLFKHTLHRGVLLI